MLTPAPQHMMQVAGVTRTSAPKRRAFKPDTVLSVGTHNVRTLKLTPEHCFADLADLWDRERLDVVMLQEIKVCGRLTRLQHMCAARGWRGVWGVSPGTQRSAGVAILMRAYLWDNDDAVEVRSTKSAEMSARTTPFW